QKEGKTSNSQTEINVATLPRGLYILKIITDKQTIMKKVVLQ
ncbi:MAG: T9SS type A sorting domain-containing protein, partial [Bacteroidales bacterium]|nr:T9SS type A sorting domain-containing protein [Bacteroidales bacterium]